MTKDIERLGQTADALALVEYWRKEASERIALFDYVRLELREAMEKLSAARAEIEQQRTRADAAEQELHNQREYHRASLQAAQTTADVALRSATPLAAKLAAIRAHLPALKRLHAWVSSERMGEWTYLEGGTFYGDVQEMAAVVADALEALEP